MNLFSETRIFVRDQNYEEDQSSICFFFSQVKAIAFFYLIELSIHHTCFLIFYFITITYIRGSNGFVFREFLYMIRITKWINLLFVWFFFAQIKAIAFFYLIELSIHTSHSFCHFLFYYDLCGYQRIEKWNWICFQRRDNFCT